jgi:hypothetical protein
MRPPSDLDALPCRAALVKALAFLAVALIVAIACSSVGVSDAAGASSTVVLTREGWLESEFGEDRAKALDKALHRIGEVVYVPDSARSAQSTEAFLDTALADRGLAQSDVAAIQIVGGGDVIPFFQMEGHDSYGAYDTDDPYADFDGDLRVDVPLARLPDGDSYPLLQRQLLGVSRSATSDDLALYVGKDSFMRWDGETIANRWLGPVNEQLTSPPVSPSSSDDIKAIVRSASHARSYIVLHGSRDDTSEFYGEDDDGKMSTGYSFADATSPGIVNAPA